MARKDKKPAVRLKRNMNTIFIVMALLIVIADIALTYTMFSLTSFSGLSKLLFIVVNILILLLVLILNFGFIAVVRTKSRNLFIVICVFLAIMEGIGCYGAYAAIKVNKNVSKIVVSETQEETVETAVVALESNGFDSIGELDGHVVGYVSGSTNAEIGKSHIDDETTNVDYVEYNDLNTLFTDLVGGEIDAAIMPENYKGIFEVVDDYEEALESCKTIDSFEETITVEVEKSDKDITSEPFTVMVFGVDEGRSDANMLVSFNPISMEITMTSIARDSYVPIACYAGHSSDKLGHAHVQGVQCAIDTIENLLDVEIDYYFESNFQGIIDIVDALDGITVNNPYEFVAQDAQDERGHYTVWIPAGDNVVLNGEQALGFARERHLYATGDFQRQANQQQVVTAILTKAMRTRNLNTLLNVLDAAGDNIKTNLSVDQLTALFKFVMEKANRYYGSDEHIENVFKIVGSRVTGYNSSVWSESAQLALSIVRPYEGSIQDNHDAITRNLDMTSEITAEKSIKWDANWEFTAPTVSNEVYAEKIVADETPDSYYCTKTGGTWTGSACACTAGNFVSGQGCSEVESAASYTDQSSCAYAGYAWDASSNSCVEKCPDGYEKDSTGACVMSSSSSGTYTLTIQYVDSNGNVIRSADYYTYDEGDTYDITAPDISGYTISNNRMYGTMPGYDATITFTYSGSGSGETEHTHEWIAGECNSDGTRHYTCKTCAETKDEYDSSCVVQHVHDTNGRQETISEATCESAAVIRYYCSANDGYYEDYSSGSPDTSKCEVTPDPDEGGGQGGDSQSPTSYHASWTNLFLFIK